MRPSTPLRARTRADRSPLLAALACAAIGAMNVISAMTPELPARAAWLGRLAPDDLVLAAHALALPSGVALLAMAYHLGHRRARAARFALLLLVALGALNLLKGPDVPEALLSWAAAGLLWHRRDAFTATHTDGRLRTALARVAAIWAAALTTATLAIVAASQWLPAGAGSGDEAVHAAGRMLVLVGPTLAVHGPVAWLNWVLGALGASAIVGSVWVLFRPIRDPAHLPGAEARQAASRLVREHGVDTLSVFKLRDDLAFHFSADGRAFCAYRIENGVLLVAGNPVGPAEAVPGLVRELCAFADVRGLRLGVVGACERAADVWEQAGLRRFYLGDEAIVDTAEFSLEGRRIRKVRQSVNRLSAAGYTAELRGFDALAAYEIAELETISTRWRDGAPERGFSMALDSLRGEHLDDSAVVVARDGDGRVRGFLHFVPTYGRPAVSLSFMRRELDTPNGLTEFLVVEAIALLRERGVEEVSLNFAAFARIMHSPASGFERLLGRVARVANPYFQIESLYRFNAKFFPRWQPRYLCYEGSLLGFGQTGLAAMWAEGQLPKPALAQPRSGRSG